MHFEKVHRFERTQFLASEHFNLNRFEFTCRFPPFSITMGDRRGAGGPVLIRLERIQSRRLKIPVPPSVPIYRCIAIEPTMIIIIPLKSTVYSRKYSSFPEEGFDKFRCPWQKSVDRGRPSRALSLISRHVLKKKKVNLLITAL